MFKKILKYVFIAIASIIALYFIAAIILPSSYKVERKIQINANSYVVYQNVSHLHKWQFWEPWLRKDSTIKQTYSGAIDGVGATMSWTSISGNGIMTIKKVEHTKSIDTELKFDEWDPSLNYWRFEEANDKNKILTNVTWGDSGHLPFMMRPMGFMMDDMMGSDFELGLKLLKDFCEIPQNGNIAQLVTDVKSLSAYTILDSCGTTDSIGMKLGELFGEIVTYAQYQKLQATTPPFALYYSIEPKVILEAGICYEKVIGNNGRIKAAQLPGGKIITASHFGPYGGFEDTYNVITKFIKENKLTPIGAPWEMYITDPSLEPNQQKWETQVFMPVK